MRLRSTGSSDRPSVEGRRTGTMAEPRERPGGGGGGSPDEGSATADSKAMISAGEYSRRVHQWLWDSYCGYMSWQSSLTALMAGAAAATSAPAAPPPAAYSYAYSYNSPFHYLLTTTPAAPAASPEPGPAARPPPPTRLAPAPSPSPASSLREPGRPAGE